MNLIRISILLCFLSYACKNMNKVEPVSMNETSAVKVFGDSVSAVGAISVEEALMSLKTKDSIPCTIQGYVTGVCQVKGCWMTLSQKASDTSGFFVKFKDYAFFVPKDLSGSMVTIKGLAYKEITPVDELKHYAEDEGKSKAEIDAINSPLEEMKFMAEGVLIAPEKK
ncbi:MAG: DUF4920 domain-containing protein [Saprospiraceae bacterium]